MATKFFDCECIVCIEFIVKGTTITFQSLIKAIKYRRHENKNNNNKQCNILLHVNAKLHAAHKTKMLLQKFKWEIWPYPPRNTELTPCDFHILNSYIKNGLSRQHFRTDDKCKLAVLNWLEIARGDLYFITGITYYGMIKVSVRSENTSKMIYAYVVE